MMITQTNPAGHESNSSDIIKDMSPHTNIHAPSFEDDEFDIPIPQVALPALSARAEEKINNHGPVGAGQVRPAGDGGGHVHQYHGHNGYNDGYYQQQQQQQWLHPEYNQMNYQQHYPQHYPSHHQYQHYGYQSQYQQDEVYMSQPHLTPPPQPIIAVQAGPGRSPSGSHTSHSTPSPHSQTELHEDHFNDLKRPLQPDSMNQQLNVAPKKPKPSRRKKKKDPNEPQKPVSAYALFFRDRQASIKGRNPNLSFGEVSKLVASMWDNLDADSKAHYKKRTEMAKKEYLRQLAAYRASIVSKGHGDDMYGYMGYPGNFHSDNGHPSAGQNIPPHPHPIHHQIGHLQPHPPQALQQQPHSHQGTNTFVTNSQDYLNQHQQTAHGTEISTGNQAGIPSLPVQHGPGSHVTGTPDGPSPVSTSSYTSIPGQHQVHGNGNFNMYDNRDHRASTGYPYQVPGNMSPHDQNHNNNMTPVAGKCSRPGCSNNVSKSADGTESTYCSSECVVGQCREAYQGWEHQQNGMRPPGHQDTQQPIVK